MQHSHNFKHELTRALLVLVEASPVRACLALFRRSFRSIVRGALLAALIAGVLVASGITAPLDRANALTKTSALSPADRAKSFGSPSLVLDAARIRRWQGKDAVGRGLLCLVRLSPRRAER